MIRKLDPQQVRTYSMIRHSYRATAVAPDTSTSVRIAFAHHVSSDVHLALLLSSHPSRGHVGLGFARKRRTLRLLNWADVSAGHSLAFALLWPRLSLPHSRLAHQFLAKVHRLMVIESMDSSPRSMTLTGFPRSDSKIDQVFRHQQ